MLKTTGARLRQVRERIDVNQEKLAELFGISQGGLSAMEKRDGAIKNKYLAILRDRYGVNGSFIQMGEGEMFVKGSELNESAVSYGIKRKDLSLAGVRARFQEQVEDYEVSHSIEHRKELAAKWEVNETHLSGVMGDRKDISLPMLLKAHEHGKLNLNYTASGEGGFYVGEGNAKYEKRIKELELVVSVMKENAELKKADLEKQNCG